MDGIHITVTDGMEKLVDAVAGGGNVVLILDGKPFAEVRPLPAPVPDLFSPEFQVRARELRALLGIGPEPIGDIVRQMRDEDD